jgi:two-component system chemotaxis response regulator CheB
MANIRKRPAPSKTGKSVEQKKITTKKSVNAASKPKVNDPFVVCVGASAGGMTAITELVGQLPASLNAAVFIVVHLSKIGLGEVLADRLRRATSLPCELAKDSETIKAGHIYVAVPNCHLLVRKRMITIGKGPAENRFRPSIDVLFRSAAANYSERAIGVILTGLLNDGAIGMLNIKKSGGHCIIQDPNEAEYPDMPLSVLQVVEAATVLPLKKIGAAIEEIVTHHKVLGIKPSEKVMAESKISERSATGIEDVSKLGDKTVFACPDCGGSLWRIQNGSLNHFRCHVGHSYSEEDLLSKQSESIEQTLWVAVRMMEERKINFNRLESEHRIKGLQKLATSYQHQANQLEFHIEKLKQLLFGIQKE